MIRTLWGKLALGFISMQLFLVNNVYADAAAIDLKKTTSSGSLVSEFLTNVAKDNSIIVTLIAMYGGWIAYGGIIHARKAYTEKNMEFAGKAVVNLVIGLPLVALITVVLPTGL